MGNIQESSLKNVIKTMLKTHMHINTSHENDRLKIELYFDEELITSDFIDYSDVVRVHNPDGITYN